MDIFYDKNIETTLTLGEEESQHCVKVMRHSVGDEIEVIDGLGTLYVCRITSAHPKRTEVEIINSFSDYGSHRFNLTMAVAPTKNIDRFEWFVEKAVEIGVDRIVPLLCDHSERKVVKRDRLEKIVISACKQSKKAKLAIVDEMTKFDDFVSSVSQDTQLLIAHCEEGYNKEYLPKAVARGGKTIVMIGPEGDFSPSEIETAMKQGGKGISLGDSRLRTETAGVMAVAMVNIATQDK